MTDTKKSQRGPAANQRGGFAVGLIVGLLIGLVLALAVALYVTKVPIPFVNKVPQRTPEQDAAEAAKNKDWDPNSPLYGKNPARPNSVASGTVAPPPTTAAPGGLPTPAVTGGVTPPAAAASSTQSTRDPAAILADKPVEPPKFTATAPAGADPFLYFVQAGAFGRAEDAEQQRAKLAMMGMEARMSERGQSGRTVYRVRVGPFDRKASADAAKDKLSAAGVDAALVRVQR
jgi:cell division protein FtsN